MKKTKILAIVVAVVIILLIVFLMIKNRNTINTEPIIETVAETFGATVISVERDNITVATDEEAAISSTSRIIYININDKTIITKEGTEVTKEDIQKEMKVKISFDGKILSTGPVTINADKIEL